MALSAKTVRALGEGGWTSPTEVQYAALQHALVGRDILGAGESVLGLRRSEEHTSELQSLMRISYAVFCLKKKTNNTNNTKKDSTHSCENNRNSAPTPKQ